jgi:hypothetical protein
MVVKSRDQISFQSGRRAEGVVLMLRIGSLLRATLFSAAIGMALGVAPAVHAAGIGGAHVGSFGGGGFHGGGGGFHGGGGGFHAGGIGHFHGQGGGFHPGWHGRGRLRNGYWTGAGPAYFDDYPYDDLYGDGYDDENDYYYYSYCDPSSASYDQNLCYDYEN